MAYTTSDVFNLVSNAAIAVGPQWWYHESLDALAAVNTSGFITDGVEKGLRVGDYVQHQDLNADGDLSQHRVLTIGAAPGAVDLSDGTVTCDGANAD